MKRLKGKLIHEDKLLATLKLTISLSDRISWSGNTREKITSKMYSYYLTDETITRKYLDKSNKNYYSQKNTFLPTIHLKGNII